MWLVNIFRKTCNSGISSSFDIALRRHLAAEGSMGGKILRKVYTKENLACYQTIHKDSTFPQKAGKDHRMRSLIRMKKKKKRYSQS